MKTNQTLIRSAVIAAFMLPSLAYADTTLTGFTTFAETVLNFMRGPIATTVSAIAIAVVGYRWFTGRMELGRAVATIGGIVLIVGSVQIVGWIRATGGFEEGTGAAPGGMAQVLPETIEFAKAAIATRGLA